MLAALAQVQTLPDFAELSLLALIQGLTEFLPVSSSGHLVLTQGALGLAEPGLVIEVALHVGTLAAVLVVYRGDLRRILAEACAGRTRELRLLALGTLPAAVVGIALRQPLSEAFSEPRIAAWGLLGTAVLLIAGESGRRARQGSGSGTEERALGWSDALLIGCAQAIAILPGISRSGATIAVGLLRGLSPAQAARFSFLLSVPAVLGAAALELSALGGSDLRGSAGPLLWATLFAGFVGWGALRTLLAFLGRGAFAWFAVYCAALGGGYLLFLEPRPWPGAPHSRPFSTLRNAH